MPSLQNLCITCIIENFAIFHRAYEKSRELQKNFEFLQRIYSQEITYGLFKKQKMDISYIPFLLSRHVKTVDLSWFLHCNEDAEREILCELDCNEERFGLYAFLQVGFISKIVTHLPNVESLCLDSDYVCDIILKLIGKYCPKLKELNIKRGYVTDEGLKKFCYPFEDGTKTSCLLKSLKIIETFVSESGACYIVNEMESLEEFRYEDTKDSYSLIFMNHRIMKVEEMFGESIEYSSTVWGTA